MIHVISLAALFILSFVLGMKFRTKWARWIWESKFGKSKHSDEDILTGLMTSIIFNHAMIATFLLLGIFATIALWNNPNHVPNLLTVAVEVIAGIFICVQRRTWLNKATNLTITTLYFLDQGDGFRIALAKADTYLNLKNNYQGEATTQHTKIKVGYSSPKFIFIQEVMDTVNNTQTDYSEKVVLADF